jgi:hypothetical protein
MENSLKKYVEIWVKEKEQMRYGQSYYIDIILI